MGKTTQKETQSIPNNLAVWEQVRDVPEEAKKTITGGRISGMTDINPMWRIKKLTEMFGICGIGWKYEIVSQRVIPSVDGIVAAFVDINLYIKDDNNEWSAPIPGTGGSMFVSSETRGMYTNDECFKMALTDAIGVSCKALGIGADVYWEKDKSKYKSEQSTPKATPQATPQAQVQPKPKTAQHKTKEQPVSEEDVLDVVSTLEQEVVAREINDGDKQMIIQGVKVYMEKKDIEKAKEVLKKVRENYPLKTVKSRERIADGIKYVVENKIMDEKELNTIISEQFAGWETSEDLDFLGSMKSYLRTLAKKKAGSAK